MPSQINTMSMKKLLSSAQRNTKILKEYWQNQVDWGEMTEQAMHLKLAERKAIEKILEEVQARKTTNIKVAQMALFK